MNETTKKKHIVKHKKLVLSHQRNDRAILQEGRSLFAAAPVVRRSRFLFSESVRQPTCGKGHDSGVQAEMGEPPLCGPVTLLARSFEGWFRTADKIQTQCRFQLKSFSMKLVGTVRLN